jgi:hypothetical protein
MGARARGRACGRAGAWLVRMAEQSSDRSKGIGRGQRGWALATEIAVGPKTAYCLADLS